MFNVHNSALTPEIEHDANPQIEKGAPQQRYNSAFLKSTSPFIILIFAVGLVLWYCTPEDGKLRFNELKVYIRLRYAKAMQSSRGKGL